MICGAPITRASSCSPINATAIPLTITDFASRYLLCCEPWAPPRRCYAFTVFERAFKDFGLPRAIRTDNGVPFASTSAFFGLCKLSVWWLRLGIGIERIKPGNPQQNGRHERMHLTLKKEATKPPAKNLPAAAGQVRSLHRVLQPRAAAPGPEHAIPRPALSPSPRPYTGLGELEYPFHDRTVTVTHCGRICFGRRKINLSQRVRRTERRHQGSRREHLAGQLYALRLGVLRSRGRSRRMCPQSRSGPNCYPCLRNKWVSYVTQVGH